MLLTGRHLFGSLDKVSDKVVSVLGLLKTTVSHLGTWDVLLWVLKVVGHVLLGPGDASSLVGVSVGVTLSLTGLSANNTVEVWTHLVWTTGLNSVALGTSGLEESSTLLSGTLLVWSWHVDEEEVVDRSEKNWRAIGKRDCLGYDWLLIKKLLWAPSWGLINDNSTIVVARIW